MSKPNCEKCEDRGWVIVPNGTDDYDKEPCECFVPITIVDDFSQTMNLIGKLNASIYGVNPFK